MADATHNHLPRQEVPPGQRPADRRAHPERRVFAGASGTAQHGRRSRAPDTSIANRKAAQSGKSLEGRYTSRRLKRGHSLHGPRRNAQPTPQKDEQDFDHLPAPPTYSTRVARASAMRDSCRALGHDLIQIPASRPPPFDRGPRGRRRHSWVLTLAKHRAKDAALDGDWSTVHRNRLAPYCKLEFVGKLAGWAPPTESARRPHSKAVGWASPTKSA